ncbi:MAG TPA: AAA family ATPase, partial [Gemmatirosa sp.]
AATTWAEYKKFFEKDPALSRRFQLVKVEEPGEEQCLVMLRGVVPALESHHKVRITDDGLDAAVRLSHRYLPDRQLPDKAVSVLDTACARLALGQQATPASLEAARRELDDLAVQERVLTREAALGADHRERLGAIGTRRAALDTQLASLTERWEQESALVSEIRTLRGKIEDAHGTAASAQDMPALRAELGEKQGALAALQGETPLMRVAVDASIVGEVISGWTGVPVGKMLRNQLGMMLQLERYLGERIIGQDHALGVISKRVRTSAAKIEDPNKPKGVFMLVGPSGVGKTETALALGDLLFGGEQNLITINMSEFQEAHTVSTLKGSPPGYVGYGEGGVLTEAVRRRPYSVVLLDEVEKAHPDVLELFFQVFDKGKMEDGEGREIDFKNAIILLTTNAGTETIMKLTADPETAPTHDALVGALKPELDKVFKPAFLGRMVLIPYFPVRDENLKKIIRLKLDKIARRLHETHRVTMTYDDAFVDAVAARCTEVESGARNVDNILSNTMLPEISRLLLEAIAGGELPGAVRVGVDADGELTYAVTPAVRDAGYSLTAAAEDASDAGSTPGSISDADPAGLAPAGVGG